MRRIDPDEKPTDVVALTGNTINVIIDRLAVQFTAQTNDDLPINLWIQFSHGQQPLHGPHVLVKFADRFEPSPGVHEQWLPDPGRRNFMASFDLTDGPYIYPDLNIGIFFETQHICMGTPAGYIIDLILDDLDPQTPDVQAAVRFGTSIPWPCDASYGCSPNTHNGKYVQVGGWIERV